MTSRNIPTDYVKVLYDWEYGDGMPISARGYVYNNLFSFAEHHVPGNQNQMLISVKPGLRIEGSNPLVLSEPPSGDFNGEALMQVGKEVEYKDWAFLLNFQEADDEWGSDLGKSRVLISSMQTPDSLSGFMVGLNDAGQLSFEYNNSQGIRQIKILDKKIINKKNVISVSYYDSTKALTLGVYDPIYKKGNYNQYTVGGSSTITGYRQDKRWYIGGTRSGISSNAEYKQFNGYIDNFLLFSGYLGQKHIDVVADSCFLTKFTPSVKKKTSSTASVPTGILREQNVAGYIQTGTAYVSETDQDTGETYYVESGLYQEVAGMTETYAYPSDASSVTMTSSAFTEEVRVYDDDYVNEYAVLADNPLTTGNDITPVSKKIFSYGAGYNSINVPQVTNLLQIVEGDNIPTLQPRGMSDTAIYKGTTMCEDEETPQDFYFRVSPCPDTIGSDPVIQLVPITGLYDPPRALDDVSLTIEECSRRADYGNAHPDEVKCVLGWVRADEWSGAVDYVYWRNVKNCFAYPCPGVTTTTSTTTTTTTTFAPGSESYFGYDCLTNESIPFVDKDDHKYGADPNWFIGNVVRINTENCLKDISRSTESLSTSNYLKCDNPQDDCVYDNSNYEGCDSCKVTTTPSPTITTPSPKLCNYEIEASLDWTNGLDLDIYLKTEDETCLNDSSTLYWGNVNYSSAYGEMDLNRDAHPSCLADPLHPEIISGTLTGPRTFWVWWNRHSNCVVGQAPDPNVAPIFTSEGKLIKITNNIVETIPATDEHLIVEITAYQSSIDQFIVNETKTSLISINGTTLPQNQQLSDNGDGTWSCANQLEKDEFLEIHDIPQVLQANGQNLGGEQNNFAYGLKIVVRDCECSGGGS